MSRITSGLSLITETITKIQCGNIPDKNTFVLELCQELNSILDSLPFDVPARRTLSVLFSQFDETLKSTVQLSTEQLLILLEESLRKYHIALLYSIRNKLKPVEEAQHLPDCPALPPVLASLSVLIALGYFIQALNLSKEFVVPVFLCVSWYIREAFFPIQHEINNKLSYFFSKDARAANFLSRDDISLEGRESLEIAQRFLSAQRAYYAQKGEALPEALQDAITMIDVRKSSTSPNQMVLIELRLLNFLYTIIGTMLRTEPEVAEIPAHIGMALP